MSQPSLSGLGDRDIDREEPTPPISPFIGSEGTSGTTAKPKPLYTQKSAPNFNRKYHDSSLDADDTESELVAIPESDLSESTLHNSAPGSFDDGIHFDEIAQPLKSEQLKGKVTTANLATAQVAITTLGVAEQHEEKPEPKKSSRLFTKLGSLDRSAQKPSSSDLSKIITKCSVQEGVRMMVTPSIFMQQKPPATEKAVINQQVNVQQAVIVTQDVKSTAETDEKVKQKEEISEVDNAKYSMGSTIVQTSTADKPIAVGPSKFDFIFYIP